MSADRTFTHPDVFAAAARGESWADPETGPTRINWTARQKRAAIPFRVVNGRPINPCGPTGIRYGRNELGHWGEQLCADAIVTAVDRDNHVWLVMVERGDGHGWALPGGYVDPGEGPVWAAFRELHEETGLSMWDGCVRFTALPARYVPDPRASDEAWMVTVPVHLNYGRPAVLPPVTGGDDARRAVWVPAVDFDCVTRHLANAYDGTVFPAHRDLLADILTD